MVPALGRKAPAGRLLGDDEISAGEYPPTVTMPLPSAGAMLGRNLGFPGLRRFFDWRRRLPRNSYRSLLCHIYELVKLGSNWTSVQYSDSEKKSKAFTEHGLA